MNHIMSQMNTNTHVPKKRSWAEMAIDEEYEEEQEKCREEEEKHKQIMENRRYLHSIGKYELEEGEILD